MSSVGAAELSLPPAGTDPSVPRPPFGFEIDIPQPWILLDLDPRTTTEWIRQFVQLRAVGRARPAADRLDVSKVLRDVIDALRAEGILLAAILAGSVGQEVIGASVTLGWREMRGGVELEALGSSLAVAAPTSDELPHHRRVDLVSLSPRPAVRLRTRQLAPVPASTHRREVCVHQLFVSTEASTWVAVVTATTSMADLDDAVGQAAIHVAGSLRAGDSTPLPYGRLAGTSPTCGDGVASRGRSGDDSQIRDG